jgi:hypothetical protein
VPYACRCRCRRLRALLPAIRRVEPTSRPCPVVMLAHARPSPSSPRAQIVAGPCFLPSRHQIPAKVVPACILGGLEHAAAFPLFALHPHACVPSRHTMVSPHRCLEPAKGRAFPVPAARRHHVADPDAC